MNESRRETSPYGKNIENLLRYFWESEIRLKKIIFWIFLICQFLKSKRLLCFFPILGAHGKNQKFATKSFCCNAFPPRTKPMLTFLTLGTTQVQARIIRITRRNTTHWRLSWWSLELGNLGLKKPYRKFL